MKKQVTILLLFISHLSLWGQNNITTKTPCTNEMAYNEKGRWIKRADNLFTTTSKAEVFKRLDAMHQMVLEVYPDPVGVDAAWHRTNQNQFFASQVKIDQTRDGVMRKNEVNGVPIATYYYFAGFFSYTCDDSKTNIMRRGWPGEASSQVYVYVNSLNNYAAGSVDDGMTIGGRPVKMRASVRKNWKGHEMAYGDENSTREGSVLIHREGMLPYIPVTRKQYLDHSLEHLEEILNKTINDFNAIPVRSLEEQEAEKKKKLEKFQNDFGNDPKRLKSAVDYYLSGYQTEQQQRDERVNKAIKNKEDILKHYREELAKTTKEGLLASPAIIKVFHSPDAQLPIFYKESEGGQMLVNRKS